MIFPRFFFFVICFIFFLLLFLSFTRYYTLSVILSVIEAEDVKRRIPYTSKIRRIKRSYIALNHVVRWYSLRFFFFFFFRLYVEERDYCFACDQVAEKVDRWIKEYMHATDIKAYFCESRWAYFLHYMNDIIFLIFHSKSFWCEFFK